MTPQARAILEDVRWKTEEFPDEPLNFYLTAKLMGASEEDAEAIDEALTIRVMKARGAI